MAVKILSGLFLFFGYNLTMHQSVIFPSPIGNLEMVFAIEGIIAIRPTNLDITFKACHKNDVIKNALDFFDKYFKGLNPKMNLPLVIEGTDFQTKIWKIILSIPYGETRSYEWVTREYLRITKQEKMSNQAVGHAIGKNPIMILIPCHRIIKKNGENGEYAYGKSIKEALLRIEKQ